MAVRIYSEPEAAALLTGELRHWTVEEGSLVRRYRTAGWKATMMASAAIGHLAEAAWHHPELALSFSRVEVRLRTHSEKAITDRDFALARKIEDVVHWRPGREGDALEGTPAEPRFAYLRYDD